MRLNRDMRSVAAAAAAAWLFAPAWLFAQDQGLEPIPTFAPGGNAVLMPVQSVRPLPTGAWPGGVRSHTQAREGMTAELTFAFREAQEGSGAWKLPPEIIDVMGRNPLLKVDPEHLAYQGLITKPKDMKRYQVYEPLHGQLRAVAAMFDTRHVAVPLQVRYEPYVDSMAVQDRENPEEGAGDEATDADAPGGAAPGSGGAGNDRTSSEPIGRAVLTLALIDIRRSEVLWHGEVRGDPSPIDSSALFATLAARVAAWLILH